MSDFIKPSVQAFLVCDQVIEDSMTKSFLASRGEGGEVLGTFPSREGALAKARVLCPD